MRLLSQGLVAPTQRTIPDFELRRPQTIAEAAAAGAADGAVYAQGCTDLFAQFREGLPCTTLVSLDKVAELREIALDGGTLTIGAAATHHEGVRHPAVTAALPGLAAAWGQIANHRIRQRATIGGNVMARRARYEISIMLDSLAAILNFIGGAGPSGSGVSPGGTVSPRASTALNGPGSLTIADVWDRRVPPGALLTAVTIPDVPGTWFGYERSLRPLLTVAATIRTNSVRTGSVRGDSVRVSVGSEMQRHFTVEAPLGTDPVAIAAALPDEIGDAVADASYRRHAAGVLLGRLLAARTSQADASQAARAGELPREEDAR
jgi:carbon-monoxide dehydrogenase medium subunit